MLSSLLYHPRVMSSRSDHLDGFLRAVHRRWVAVRVAEAVGVAVLGGCVLSLLVLPILLWRGEPALPVVLTATAVAAVAGLIAGVLRRPDLLSAATEADRQLQLADLLSTALTTRDRSAVDPWALLVVATADARCRTLAPNAIVLNRLGGRAWGGIGLTAALVLTLGLMSANPHPSAAVATAGDDPIALKGTPHTPPLASMSAPDKPPQHRRDPHDPGEAGVERETAAVTDATVSNDQATRTGSAADGGGAGLATSPDKSNTAPSPLAGAPPTASSANPDGIGSGGGGASTASTAPGEDAAAGSAVTSHSHQSAAASPPWHSLSWSAAREGALAAVRDRRVPDNYRDLVRAYFEEQQH